MIGYLAPHSSLVYLKEIKMNVQIRQAGRYVYDVFFGNGYDNWSRVRRNTWGVSVLAGGRLSPKVCKQLNEHFANQPVASINTVNLGA
jgi:hypothetical protein